MIAFKQGFLVLFFTEEQKLQVMSAISGLTQASILASDDAGEMCLSVPAQRLDSEVVTVKATGRSAYAYCVRAARRVSWFITVKAREFAAAVESRVRAFLGSVFPMTGVDILRQSAILLS